MEDRTARRDALFETIKGALRARGITYRELGERLGLSESGVKKVFAARDCALDRLLAISDVLGVDLEELVAASREAPIERVVLGHSAQRWLLAHPTHFAWFWWLTTERVGPGEIRQTHGRSISEMRRCLDDLAEQGLIELDAYDRVRRPALLRWEDDGPLMEVLHRLWSASLVEQAGRGGWIRLHQLELTREAWEELEATLSLALDGALRTSGLGRALGHPSERGRAVVALAPGGFDPGDLEPR